MAGFDNEQAIEICVMHLHAAEWEVEIASNVYVAEMERLRTVSAEQCVRDVCPRTISAMNTVNRKAGETVPDVSDFSTF